MGDNGTLVPSEGEHSLRERNCRWSWRRLSLSAQFGILAALIILGATAILGEWLSARIADSQLRSRAESAALYMEGFLARHVEVTETGPRVSPARREELDHLLANADLSRRIESLRVWRRDGEIVYSTDNSLIGRRFPSTNVDQAFTGNVVVHLEYGHDDEGERPRDTEEPLIEIYAPIYSPGTRDIIAVGEVYETAQDFIDKRDLVQRQTWLLVTGTTFSIFGALFFVVHRADKTIIEQRLRLKTQLAEARALAQQNEELRRAADKARLDASALNETFLNRLGSDLHDGPLQLLGALILRLGADSARDAADGKSGSVATASLSSSAIARQVFTELRDLSTGLVMPEIAQLSLEDALKLAVDRHQFTSGTTVKASYENLPSEVPEALKICLYRAVQEGLTNAFRHAGGIDQQVIARAGEEEIKIIVSDSGPGVPESTAQHRLPTLGLAGIHNRVQSFGGSVEIRQRRAKGTELVVTVPVRFADRL
ncbi:MULTISPECIES: sensor histidine kinase [unclassified Rhizobium]|uniref:sensor histidine kinase n=1 Tax=unclassified Rhizobium TaxID=2613769 RepID=UPI001ADA7FA3|nr:MULTISPECIES: ATP-binding protein [unclassified Rhizobium]MBO9127187.1 ATP-binding protein [Rhizobium sp. 16-488-2b]MBO9177634.1 ATP-binding protein [Rhizobium sp. 16-488-2a]